MISLKTKALLSIMIVHNAFSMEPITISSFEALTIYLTQNPMYMAAVLWGTETDRSLYPLIVLDATTVINKWLEKNNGAGQENFEHVTLDKKTEISDRIIYDQALKASKGLLELKKKDHKSAITALIKSLKKTSLSQSHKPEKIQRRNTATGTYQKKDEEKKSGKLAKKASKSGHHRSEMDTAASLPGLLSTTFSYYSHSGSGVI